MARIRLEEVTVVLKGRQGGSAMETVALDAVNLSVRDGETMGVIGPTGCGKSTLLRAVAGLVPLASGRVFIDDIDQVAVPPKDRGLGMVFQEYALYPHLDVFDNLAFYFKLRKREPEVPDKVRDAAEILGVDFRLLLDRKPGQLSLGQRQQVAIARCLVRDPRIFLMDEPFANLDPIRRQQARIEVARLLRRFRVTTFYVTHDQHEAASLCDRIAVLLAGRVLQVDTYLHLLDWPNTLAVAQFVSEPGAEFVEGAAMEGHFACPYFSLPLASNIQVRTHPGQGLTAAIRPSAVAVADAAAEGVLLGQVDWIEPLPLQRLQRVTCRLNGRSLTVEVSQSYDVHPGDRVPLRIDPEGVQIFDTNSGLNLALQAAPAG